MPYSKCPGFEYPSTPDEWWQLATAYKDELLQTIKMFNDDIPQSTRLSSEGGYRLAAEFDDEQGRASADLVQEFMGSFEQRDHNKALSVLNAVFFKAPDVYEIHGRPAWNVLCDLLSEVWVFDAEELGVTADA